MEDHHQEGKKASRGFPSFTACGKEETTALLVKPEQELCSPLSFSLFPLLSLVREKSL